MSTIKERATATDLVKVYYEGGEIDRYWLAPLDLGLIEAKRQRCSRLYKTHHNAVKAMLRHNSRPAS